MKVRPTIAAVGALLALAGCSATSTPSKSTTASPGTTSTTTTSSPSTITAAATTATTAPKPKPVVWTVREAGQHYLALVKPSNATKKKISSAVRAHHSIRSEAKLAALEARQIGTFIYGLNSGRWPAVVRPQIKALIALELTDRIGWRDVSTARTLSEWNDAMNSWDDTKMVAAAGQVRLALGLPLN